MGRNKRFALAIDYLYRNGYVADQRELSKKTGITETSISRIINNKVKQPSQFTLRKLNTAFGNIFNMAFFRCESNTMLASENTGNIAEPIEDYGVVKKGCPYYNVDFTLGFDLLENDQTIVPDSYIDFQQYNNCTCWVNAHGDSMHPTISSGDMVALKKIEDYRYLINGEIYAIVTKNGLRTIKRVNDRGKNIQLIPDNKEYEEQYIPKDELLAVFSVKGCMKAY